MSSLQDLIDEFEEIEAERLECMGESDEPDEDWPTDKEQRYAYLESFDLARLQRKGAYTVSNLEAYGRALWEDLGYEIPDAVANYVTIDYTAFAEDFLVDLDCIEVADSDGDIVVIYTP